MSADGHIHPDELAEPTDATGHESRASECEAQWQLDALLLGASETEENATVCEAVVFAVTDYADAGLLARLVFGRTTEADNQQIESIRERVRAAVRKSASQEG